jgi:hypothetical protein
MMLAAAAFLPTFAVVGVCDRYAFILACRERTYGAWDVPWLLPCLAIGVPVAVRFARADATDAGGRIIAMLCLAVAALIGTQECFDLQRSTGLQVAAAGAHAIAHAHVVWELEVRRSSLALPRARARGWHR